MRRIPEGPFVVLAASRSGRFVAAVSNAGCVCGLPQHVVVLPLLTLRLLLPRLLLITKQMPLVPQKLCLQ